MKKIIFILMILPMICLSQEDIKSEILNEMMFKEISRIRREHNMDTVYYSFLNYDRALNHNKSMHYLPLKSNIKEINENLTVHMGTHYEYYSNDSIEKTEIIRRYKWNGIFMEIVKGDIFNLNIPKQDNWYISTGIIKSFYNSSLHRQAILGSCKYVSISTLVINNNCGFLLTYTTIVFFN